jgi:hypothetical protein
MKTKKTTTKKKATAKKKSLTELTSDEISNTNKVGFAIMERIAKAQEQQVKITKQMVERLDKWEKIFMRILEKEDPEQFAIITSATAIKDIKDGN